MGDSNDILFNPREHSRHMLFCGTHVIQTRFYENQKVTAVVIHTGETSSPSRIWQWYPVRSVVTAGLIYLEFALVSHKDVFSAHCYYCYRHCFILVDSDFIVDGILLITNLENSTSSYVHVMWCITLRIHDCEGGARSFDTFPEAGEFQVHAGQLQVHRMPCSHRSHWNDLHSRTHGQSSLISPCHIQYYMNRNLLLFLFSVFRANIDFVDDIRR